MLTANKPKNARELRALLFDSDGKRRGDSFDLFEAACQEGRLRLSDFSVQDIAKAFLGDSWEKQFTQLSLRESIELREAGFPVTSSVFPQITSQLLFSEIRAQFMAEANVFSPIVPVIKSTIRDAEIVPSITNPDPDGAQDVLEGQEYPTVGVTEEYFTLPAKTKKGMKINLTREAIFHDKTAMLVDAARKIGEALGSARENAVIDALIGQTNNYSRNGTPTNTYLTAGAYINNQSSLALEDWTDVDAALQLFVDILDPNTSEPLSFQPKHLVVMPYKVHTARRIISATEVRTAQNAAAGTRSEETISPNPITALGLQLLSSIRLYRRVLAGPESVAATAREGWFLGDLTKALAWYECWPLELVQRGRDSQDGFDRDVEMQFKASYYGVAAVREPRYVARLESTAW